MPITDLSLFFPAIVGVKHQLRIVVPDITRDLASEKGRRKKGLVLGRKLHFGNDQSEILTEKLIHFKCMATRGYQITDLFYPCSWLAEQHQLFRFGQRNLLLPLITAHAAGIRGPFDSEVTLVTSNAHTHRTSALGADVALHDAAVGSGQLTIAVVADQKLAFYLLCHKSENQPAGGELQHRIVGKHQYHKHQGYNGDAHHHPLGLLFLTFCSGLFLLFTCQFAHSIFLLFVYSLFKVCCSDATKV